MPQFQNLRANIPAPICPGTDSPPRRNFLLRGAGPASPFPRLAPGAPPSPRPASPVLVPPLHPLRLHPLAQPLPSAPRPFARDLRPAHASFLAPTFLPHLSKNRKQPLPSDLLWHAPPLLFAPPPSSIPQALTPYAPRRTPAAAGNPRTPARLCSCRFLRLRSRTNLPLTAEESPHAPPRQLQPHAPPRADCQNVHSSGKPHSPPYSLRPCVPHLLSAPLFLRPQSRNLQPPAHEPPSVSPCSRPASPAPRPADLSGFRLRQASRAALRACVYRVSAEVDLSAQTARKPPRSPHFRSVPATDECSARYEFKTKKARTNPGLEICGAEGQN